ncbi:ASKHA domain-containing protein [Dissulfuribacter thermophilus]|uniref:ASKHA domain-containing protein n=1 Tax=Dissulfuribacter thermophilus TaxID=1156395 RepID=UPI000834F5FA|nr:ASKHA domain-containing protein [Dissulfuribacter thermophilus]
MKSSTSQKSRLSEPVARLVRVSLARPSLNDNRSPETRLREALEGSVFLPLSVIKDLSRLTFSEKYDLDCILLTTCGGQKVARVDKATKLRNPLGVAIDLGSTTIVLYLLDLVDGKELARRTYENPQRAHGEDILARILYASKNDGLERLKDEVLDVFNKGIVELTSEIGSSPEDVYFCSIAGNTTMIHFLLGLDPSHICKEPYIPCANTLDILKSKEIGLKIHPEGEVYCFPNVGSYFGGDLLAGIIASGMHTREEISMLIDVGTNAEVVLGNSSWMVACAGAAGPALEGGILTCGMRAEPGAIERVTISPEDLTVTYKTIKGERPKGLCGSGIIDLLAELFVAGLVDPTGKLEPQKCPERMRDIDGETAFVVAFENESYSKAPIFITQSDIKNLIRSKGAMYTILNVVLQSVGIGFEDVDKFYVAGAFGNYIDPEKAVTIGMLPDVPLNKFVGLGNAAGLGAKELLLNQGAIKEANEITKKITYLEMNVRGDFMSQLTGALFLPHTDRSKFPNVWKKIKA